MSCTSRKELNMESGLFSGKRTRLLLCIFLVSVFLLYTLSVSGLWQSNFQVSMETLFFSRINTATTNSTNRNNNTLEESSNATNTNGTSEASGIIYDTDLDFLIPKLKQFGLRVSKGAGIRHQPARTEYERSLMDTPALTDFKLAPDELKSIVELVRPKTKFKVGDKIQIRVDLVNGLGLPRHTGGDEVRIRLTSESRKAAIAAAVEDMRNGSYVGTAFLPWKGLTFVAVYLTYPREFLREIVRLRLSLRATKWIAAVFSSKSLDERTACLPSPPVPGYKELCNVTGFNGGLAYFCGRPTDTRLTCSQRRHFVVLPSSLAPFPLSSPALRHLVAKIDRKPYLRLIPNTISITTMSGRPVWTDLPPCWTLPRRVSWQNPAPTGWMDEQRRWMPSTCTLQNHYQQLGLLGDHHHHQHQQQQRQHQKTQKLQNKQTKKMPQELVHACLQNSSVFLLGDSNMRLWWDELRSYLPCSKEFLSHDIHVHRLCEVNATNTFLKWAFHGRPSSTNPKSDNIPLPLALEELRHHIRHLQRRVIVVLHYYLHFSYYDLGDYVDRVRTAKHYISQFLMDYPKAMVFIRGPHVVFDGVSGEHLTHGDNLGPVYIQIWKEEFRDLWEKMWFLDYWDMTIATQNMASHPPRDVVREMVKLLLGHVCAAE